MINTQPAENTIRCESQERIFTRPRRGKCLGWRRFLGFRGCAIVANSAQLATGRPLAQLILLKHPPALPVLLPVPATFLAHMGQQLMLTSCSFFVQFLCGRTTAFVDKLWITTAVGLTGGAPGWPPNPHPVPAWWLCGYQGRNLAIGAPAAAFCSCRVRRADSHSRARRYRCR